MAKFKVGDLVVRTGDTDMWNLECAVCCIDPTKPLKVKDVWSNGNISLEGVRGSWATRHFCLHLHAEPDLAPSKFNVGDHVTRSVLNRSYNPRWYNRCMASNLDPYGEHEVTDVDFVAETMTLGLLGHGWSWYNFTKVAKTDSEGAGPNPVSNPEGTYTGGSADYYTVTIDSCTTEGRPAYIVECNDIIEKLGMNYAEGNAFKALWRRAAQRTLGLRKKGSKDDGLYDAEKVEFFGKRLVEQSKALAK